MFSVGQPFRFSEWLQLELDRRGWSQSDCARSANLNRAVVHKLLSGKCEPQPRTLAAIARALKIPIETAYRAAGLLPPPADGDDTTLEVVHIFKSLQSPQRRATAIMLLKALAAEEENEQRSNSQEKHG